jgi:hypothetical protein
VCGRTAAPTIANDLLRPESLPAPGINSAWGTIISDLYAASPPALLSTSATSVQGKIVVQGEGFSAGGRVYIAIYDEMGALLYETRWTTATPAVGITGTRAEVPEAHPITQTLGGNVYETFGGLCGARVLIRAYNKETATWSNWLAVAPLCQLPPTGFGPH